MFLKYENSRIKFMLYHRKGIMTMKKIKAIFLVLFMLLVLSACGGGSSSNNGGHSYKYKYPTGVEHAVWWEMHENRIKEEPSITEWEGYKHIEVKLDLEDIGYLG